MWLARAGGLGTSTAGGLPRALPAGCERRSQGAQAAALALTLLHRASPRHRPQLTNTQFKAVKSIEGADFTDSLLRKDVAMGLCKIAKGTNPTTGVDTRESLGCP